MRLPARGLRVLLRENSHGGERGEPEVALSRSFQKEVLFDFLVLGLKASLAEEVEGGEV